MTITSIAIYEDYTSYHRLKQDSYTYSVHNGVVKLDINLSNKDLGVILNLYTLLYDDNIPGISTSWGAIIKIGSFRNSDTSVTSCKEDYMYYIK